MITEKITYNSLLELGFKREDVDDSVWKGETGFDYFIVSKDYESYIFCWDIHKHEISVEKIFQNGLIFSCIFRSSLLYSRFQYHFRFSRE